MSKPKQPRVNVYLRDEDYEFLKEWSEKQMRSMGNLAAYIVATAIQEEREKQEKQNV